MAEKRSFPTLQFSRVTVSYAEAELIESAYQGCTKSAVLLEQRGIRMVPTEVELVIVFNFRQEGGTLTGSAMATLDDLITGPDEAAARETEELLKRVRLPMARPLTCEAAEAMYCAEPISEDIDSEPMGTSRDLLQSMGAGLCQRVHRAVTGDVQARKELEIVGYELLQFDDPDSPTPRRLFKLTQLPRSWVLEVQ